MYILDSSFYQAVASNDVGSLVKLLTLNPHVIDVPSPKGQTLLHLAAKLGFCQIIEVLIHMGSCAIDTQDHLGNTPLHYAAFWDFPMVIETLIHLGSSSINFRNNQSEIPINLAHYKKTRSTLVYLGSEEDDSLLYDEDEASKVRQRVYFDQSLLHRCFDHPIEVFLSSKRILH